MTEQRSNSKAVGHPIKVLTIEANEVSSYPELIESMFQSEYTGVIIRGALQEAVVERAVDRLTSDGLTQEWGSPNTGMEGGEIRTIGDAATPCFTAFRGPTAEDYRSSALRHDEYDQAVFGDDDPMTTLKGIFSGLFGGRPSAPPSFDQEIAWLPYNYRALDPGIQIYSHHDDHFGLPIYEQLDECYDRTRLLSWFVTLQPAQMGGKLVVYGLWRSDPNPPMLPSRFIDTEALERDYKRYTFDLGAGDLVIFNAGRHVHRVTPVAGSAPRLTVGGFMTTALDRSRLAFWS